MHFLSYRFQLALSLSASVIFGVGFQELSAADKPERTAQAELAFLQQKKPWENFRKPSKKELKKKLSSMQYEVTQEEGTERAFKNEFWDNKKAGIYVDIVSGEPLYSSTDKYKSGTGWPSFVKPIDSKFIVLKVDPGFFYDRTEVRSKIGDSHLGHVFDDGPADRGGKRYCMNSAAMRFIPKEKMEEEGYGEYLPLVEGSSK